MTNEQTALASLRQLMIKHRDELKQMKTNNKVEGKAIAAFVALLDTYIDIHIPDRLPTEREQMEKCYNDGYDKGIYEYKNTTTKTDAIDYFNQNYKQDGK